MGLSWGSQFSPHLGPFLGFTIFTPPWVILGVHKFSPPLGPFTPLGSFTPLGNSQGDLSFSGISPPLGSCFIRRFFSFSLHLKSNLLWCFHEKKLKFSESSQTAGPKPPRPNGAHHDLHSSSQSAFVPFPRSESFCKSSSSSCALKHRLSCLLSEMFPLLRHRSPSSWSPSRMSRVDIALQSHFNLCVAAHTRIISSSLPTNV